MLPRPMTVIAVAATADAPVATDTGTAAGANVADISSLLL